MFEAVDDFRKRLSQGGLLIGPGINLTDPRSSEALADRVDFLWIDLEHSNMSPEAMGGHLLAARGKKKPAFVRIQGIGTQFIKPVLDAGADGIVVPQVESAEQVEQIVADCRYPPEGRRGFGPLVPTNYGRESLEEYVQKANTSIFVTVMIETVQALQSIDKIVAVKGLDSVVLGPWDLSGALGLLGQVEHPTVVAAMEEIIAKAAAAGLSVGSGAPADPEFISTQAKRGVRWIQAGSDITFMVSYVDRVYDEIRQNHKT